MNRKLTPRHIEYLIALERSGKITAQDILADAKVLTSPLHDLYDWNVEAAAEAHWLDRTREIVRLVRYVVHTETHTVKLPRYVRDPDVPRNVQGYTTLETLRVDPRLARRALIAEFERVTSALRRGREIAIGLDLETDIDDILARVAGVRAIVAATTQDSTTGGELQPNA